MVKSELERLAAIETRLDGIEKLLSNHLKHHWAIELILAATFLSIIVKMFF